jgi:hypothetical protein
MPIMKEKDAQIAALQWDLHAQQARLDFVEQHTVIERARWHSRRSSGFHRVGAPGQQLGDRPRGVRRS